MRKPGNWSEAEESTEPRSWLWDLAERHVVLSCVALGCLLFAGWACAILSA